MKLIDKIKNIKVNSKSVIIISILIIPIIIGFGINYCFYTPSPINKYIASNLYKEPANAAFDDDNFYQCVVDAYNSENNTSLQYTYNLSDSQLKTITRLSCVKLGLSDDEKIKSTEGLEKLESLTALRLGGHNITSIDVSNNIKLIELDLGVYDWGNKYGNQVTEINLTNNTNLESLDLSYNNINKLVIDKNVALKELYVNGNPLNELNVENNFELEILYIRKKYSCRSGVTHFGCEIGAASKNLLTNLNLRENANLKELYVSGIGLTSLDLSNNFKLEKLSVDNNPLNDPLNLYNNTSLKYLTADGVGLSSLNNNTQLTELSLVGNELKEINVTHLKELFALQLSANHLTSLDVRENTNLEYLDVSANQLTSLSVSNNPKLITLEVSGNQLTSLILSNNPNLTTLGVSDNQLTSLSVSNNPKLTTLGVSGNQLTSLILSNNPKLTYLYANYNQLESLDVSGLESLKTLRVYGNHFKLILSPILLGDTLNHISIVKLPKQLVPTTTTKLSDGLKETDVGILTTKPGTQNYVVLNRFGVDVYEESYNVEVVDIKSDKYDIDKTKDYIIVGNDDNDTVSRHITIENGTATIEEDSLVVMNGNKEVKSFKLIRLSSSVYDLSKDYIYVGTTKDEDIINNIETNAEISISDNNILNIKYGDNYNENYTLIRLNASYDISKGYIYTWDSNYLDNINVINGSKEIIDNNLIIKYIDIELDKIPILNLYSDSYIIKENYIYTGLSNIDLSKITTTNNLELSTNDNKVILTYKDNIIDEIPYYYLKSNSNDIRLSSINNKIYVKNTMMTYRELLQYIVFNNGGQSLILFDKNDNGITNNNLLIEEGSYITLYGNTDMKHIIEVNTEYVEYKVEANVHYTDNYGIDIIKNLNNNNTFINVKDLIETDGNLSIFDKEDNMLEDTSNIKTGDKVIVTFPSSNKYYIYLSVKGDVTGKGIISNDDVLEAYSILRGKKVEDYYRFASDVTNDGQIRINDIAKLYHYVNNKIESLD